jgi:hypothetical protein
MEFQFLRNWKTTMIVWNKKGNIIRSRFKQHKKPFSSWLKFSTRGWSFSMKSFLTIEWLTRSFVRWLCEIFSFIQKLFFFKSCKKFEQWDWKSVISYLSGISWESFFYKISISDSFWLFTKLDRRTNDGLKEIKSK